MQIVHQNPFGIHWTKRETSYDAEILLFEPTEVRNHGIVELVDYMGGDLTVERVATSGHGRKIFGRDISKQDFLEYLASNNILTPFKSVQIKVGIRAPIEVALSLVYDPRCSVNEYSARYSNLLESAFIPNFREVSAESAMDVDRASKIVEILVNQRKKAFANYEQLINLDLARELARSGLGTNNDTKFYWKIDLLSLSDIVHSNRFNWEASPYLDPIRHFASYVAPLAWNALVNFRNNRLNIVKDLPLPKDDDVIDPPLSGPLWEPSNTRRKVVESLEAKLFVADKVLDHGQFQVVDYMGDDQSLAQAARTSYGDGTKTLQADTALIRSLIRDLHTSPIEMAEMAFETKAPVFTDPRQAGRHRTLDFHGFMGYIPIGNQFYTPVESQFKYQDRVNRQGRGKDMDQEDKRKAMRLFAQTEELTSQAVKELRALRAPEKLVRSLKGVSHYTKIWRTGDVHNLGHFLRLRLDAHAQKEVREYASMVDKALASFVPEAHRAIHEYIIGGMRLSAGEVELIKSMPIDGRLTDADLNDPNSFKGAGFVKQDNEKGPSLTREGQAFQLKLKKLLARF